MSDDRASALRYISVRDPAIDRERSHLRGPEGYEGTHDRTKLVMHSGASPVIFVLRPLDFHDVRFVRAADSTDMQMVRAVCMGLEAIEGYPNPGAQTWRGTATVKRPSGERASWKDDELGEIERAFGWAIFDELGLVLYERAQRGNAWSGSAKPYTLPLYVWAELVDAAPPRAA
jgi:hypothetical protein